MESSELDRLDTSVKQLVDRLGKAEVERERLRTERQELKNRLDQQSHTASRIADDQLKEVKARLLAVAKRLEEIENLI